jgi:hypothetical protein
MRWPDKAGGSCGEVTITRADGTVETQPPLSRAELRKIVPEPKRRRRRQLPNGTTNNQRAGG